MPRLSTLLLAVFLAACANPPPRGSTLEQGAPMPVRPPAFNPTTDAPHTVGQPGYVPQALPRSPHSRVLPETPVTRRAPGIWAGDGPRVVTMTPPAILGVALPLPEPEDGSIIADIEVECARTMGDALSRSTSAYRRLNIVQTQCLAARLFFACADLFMDAENEAKYHGIDFDAARYEDRDATRHRAKLFAGRLCDGIDGRGVVDGAERTVLQYWMMLLRGATP